MKTLWMLEEKSKKGWVLIWGTTYNSKKAAMQDALDGDRIVKYVRQEVARGPKK